MRRRPGETASLLVGLVLCGALVVPAGAEALAVPPDAVGPPELSPRLQVLSTPKVRAQTTSRQAQSVGLEEDGPASLIRDGKRVVVSVRVVGDAGAAVPALRTAGAEVLHVSDEYASVTASVSPADLPAIARVGAVRSVAEVLAPLVDEPVPPTIPSLFDGPSSILTRQTCRGARTSAGDVQLKAAEARERFGVDGSGTTVGILSDSFARATNAPSRTADIATGDLPGPANPCGFTTPTGVLIDSPTNQVSDEGRAMAQIVHDIAPGAGLSFATAYLGLESFADQIRALKADGADVIVDDISYFAEPFFQDGPISKAVNDVTAGPTGAPYFSSAGNNNIIDSQGRNISSWESPAYRATAGCPAPVAARTTPAVPEERACVDFDPDPVVTDTTFGITVAPGKTLRIDLQWAQPWFGVTTDLDLYIMNNAETQLLGWSEGPDAGPTGSQKPFAITGYVNEGFAPQTVKVVINRPITPGETNTGDAGTPRLKFVMANNSPTSVTWSEYPESSGGDIVGPTIFGQSGAENAISVAAEDVRRPGRPEEFSSRGPRALYFAPVDGTTPAAPLATPKQLAKPDLTASDCGDNTRFGGTFCGTSAAAPHAAAVAALALSAKPTATHDEIVDAISETATPFAGHGPEAVGAGRVDANATLDRLVDPSPTGATTKPFFTTTGSITTADPSQKSSIFRDGQASGCGMTYATSLAAGTLENHYDAYPFVNLTNETQCIRVDLSAPPACRASPHSLYSATYVPTFFSWNPLAGADGISGLSPITETGVGYFVSVPPGVPYTVVVNEITANAGCASYDLRLDATAPYALTRPTIGGAPQTDATLTADPGDWNGPASLGYEWQRCNGAGRACLPIPGASGSTYTPTDADLDAVLRVMVTATQSGASSSSTSDATALITPPGTTTAPPATTTATTPLPTVVPTVPSEPPPAEKAAPTARIRRTTMRLTGPGRPVRGKLGTYRVIVRAQSTTGKTSRLRGQTIRVLIDGKRRVTVRTDRRGRATFRVRFTRGSHRIQLVSPRRAGIPAPPTVVRTIRTRG